jgi:hypothetical protein
MQNLAIVTGSYGGMGFNPWSTFDPNASGNPNFYSSLTLTLN